jgi:hypothetical protein
MYELTDRTACSAGAAQLRLSGKSICCYKVRAYNRTSSLKSHIAGCFITRVDPCRLTEDKERKQQDPSLGTLLEE